MFYMKGLKFTGHQSTLREENKSVVSINLEMLNGVLWVCSTHSCWDQDQDQDLSSGRSRGLVPSPGSGCCSGPGPQPLPESALAAGANVGARSQLSGGPQGRILPSVPRFPDVDSRAAQKKEPVPLNSIYHYFKTGQKCGHKPAFKIALKLGGFDLLI